MKKTAYILLAAIAFMSCTKDRLMYSEEQYNAVNLTASISQSISTIGLLATEVALYAPDTGAVRGIPCSHILQDGTYTYTLFFGDTTNTDFDGRKRAGIVKVGGKETFPDAADSMWIQFINFYENGVEYNGMLNDIEDGNPTLVKRLTGENLSIKYGNRSISLKLTETLQPLNDLGLMMQASIAAEATGDQTFSISPLETMYYYTNTHCFEKGKLSITTPSDKVLIHFGNGELDGLATATSEEFRYILKLTNF